MRSRKFLPLGRLVAAAATVSLLVPAGARAQGLPISPTKLLLTYSKPYSVYKKSKDLVENYYGCLARGGDKTTCTTLAAFCYYQSIYMGKAYPSFISAFQLLDVFKIDCGKGVCYQCCYVPGSGCHSSFQGFPVINCNANYGAGTRRAGDTLIVPPPPPPGSSCLTTPQTCEHIPLCNYDGKKDIAALEASLKKGTSHALNWPSSLTWKRLTVANSVRTACIKHLDQLSTDEEPLAALDELLTGRGCKGWQSNMTQVWPLDWTVSAFEVKDSSGNAFLPASHYNAMVQLCTYRVLAALPNLASRLDMVEAMVYTAASKATYLAQVADPDKELLKYAGPEVLAILKTLSELQDYKLLAVPVSGEASLAGLFNGCNLGLPPQLDLSYVQDGATGVKLTVTVTDPEYPITKLANPLFVLWGDGTITSTSVPAGQPLILSHTYAVPGPYVVLAVGSNDSGLRGITALSLKTAGTAGAKTAPTAVPALEQVTFEQFDVVEKSLSGNDFVGHVELLASDGTAEHRIGLSGAKTIKLNSTTSFGDLVGHNPAGMAITSLILKPHLTLGFAIGLSEMYMVADSLRLDIYDTEKDAYLSVKTTLQASQVKVYPKGQSTPIPAASLTTDSLGRLKIPLFSKVSSTWTVTERVEVPLSASMFSSLLLGPAASPPAEGKQWKWIEPKPNTLSVVPVCGNIATEKPEECDDGNTIDGDGCSAACKTEKTPAGVVTFTATRQGPAGVQLAWSTSSLQNCKSFSLLRCQGSACTKASHTLLASIAPLPCLYGTGTQSYKVQDATATTPDAWSYYLLQTGADSSTTDYGPALVAALPPDAGPPDLALPDLSKPDLLPPDAALPDKALPDMTNPDAAAPDAAAPDSAPLDHTVAEKDMAVGDLPATMPDSGSTDPDTGTSGGSGGTCEVASTSDPEGGGLLPALLVLLRRRARGRRGW